MTRLSHLPLKIVSFWLLTALATCLQADTLLVHGDSLSAGYGLQHGEEWPALLQQRLDDKGYNLAVVNTSISGETTTGGLMRFAGILEKHRPKVVILELGANDGLRGQAVKTMRENLAAMIEAAQKNGAKVMLAGIRIPPNYGSRYTNAFHQVYFDLKDNYNVSLLPFLLDGVAGNDGLMQDDDLHPTAEAQPLILDNIWQKLEPLLQTTATQHASGQ